jgi:hypothetical protein
MLKVAILSVIKLNVVMLNAIVLNVAMLSVFMLSHHAECCGATPPFFWLNFLATNGKHFFNCWLFIFISDDLLITRCGSRVCHFCLDLKRIIRYKLALIFTSADHRKFLCLFGSEAARLSTSNEATLEGYAIKHVFNHCDSIMKNVNYKKTATCF